MGASHVSAHAMMVLTDMIRLSSRLFHVSFRRFLCGCKLFIVNGIYYFVF